MESMSPNNSAPLVTVVTPVYNGEKYLAHCIESVLAQTYENWQYLIVGTRAPTSHWRLRTPMLRKIRASPSCALRSM